ncbi:MAG: site-specific DNA-methyltransferase [Deltaproteobacteria bacterium]|nr:site-specific DNA-methyltransferase [Deltaproteobacteria bacterium]
MDKLEKRLMQTPNINKERLLTLKKLFPDIFTLEGKLNPDEFKKIINPELAKDTERFEFKWFGKTDAKRKAFTPSKAAIFYDEKKSVNPNYADGNIIIEGENLETLKCLLAGYREKIKCIYIDPPYNTGNDFIYSDTWKESNRDYWEHIGATENGIKVDTNRESDGRYHSKWLNMIYPRLLVARQLLREDGVIFISIDDNEVHHLRKVCDEVFGEENFVAHFPWKKRTAKSDVPFGISQDFEWILCYTKSNFYAGLLYERKYYKTNDYPNDRWRLSDLTTQKIESDRPNSAFDLIDPKTGKIYKYNPKRLWGITKDTFKNYYKKGKIVFPDDYDFLNISIPAYRVFESEDKLKAFKKYGSEDSIKAVSTQFPKEIGMNEDGNKEIYDIFNIKIFSFPKPLSLIKYLIKIVNGKDSIILDFFAGSGTTAQAVMELNKEDGGDRRFILVQLPELTGEKTEAYKAGYKKISDITIERCKKVIERDEKKKSLIKDNNKTGFKVYKLSKSNFPRVYFTPNPKKTEAENLKLLDKYIAEKEKTLFIPIEDEREIFDETLLKNGFTLNYTLQKLNFKENRIWLVKDKFKETLICIDADIKKNTLTNIEQYKEKLFICLGKSLDTTTKWYLKHIFGDNLTVV